MTAEVNHPRSEILELVERLAGRLEEAGVLYCHWKSNEAIDRSLVADNDLDLLVDHRQLRAFLEVATRLGFRLAVPPPARRVPGHLSLFGHDEGTGRLVQIDAQTRLVLGDDMTKNYRLPIEQAYLEELQTSEPLPLPRPEMEYLVFLVRMVLKHCPWDAQVSYKARLTASERRELAYLEERIDPDAVERLRALHLPFIPPPLLARLRQALGRELGAVARAAVARELTAALEGFGRHSPGADTFLKLSRRVAGRVRRRLAPTFGKKTPAGGGLVVAVVGGDGAGKSSAVQSLESFLGRHFRTRRLHMGKPPPGALTRVARPVLRRLPGGGPPSGLAPWQEQELTHFPGYRYLVSHLLTARDRYRGQLSARRAAAGGTIVICDRFPLRGLETMDCPRLQRLPGVDSRPLARWMRRRESAYYDRMTEPDAVFVLKVAPDMAVSRRDDQGSEFVRRRAAEIYRREWKESNVFVVDAGRPLDEVQREVRALTWSLL